METKKQLVCNDCGCRFEIGERKGPTSEEKKKPVTAPRISCPECQSYNVTTA